MTRGGSSSGNRASVCHLMMDRQNVSVHAVGYIQKLNDSLTHTVVCMNIENVLGKRGEIQEHLLYDSNYMKCL